MRRTALIGRLEAMLCLIGLAYLGFWAYGLLMGVFEIDQLIGFTIVAVAIIAALIVYGVRVRRRAGAGVGDPELERATRHQREVRGF